MLMTDRAGCENEAAEMSGKASEHDNTTHHGGV